MEKKLLAVRVSSRGEAPEVAKECDHVISISDVGAEAPIFFHSSVLVMKFDDEEDPKLSKSPTIFHIDAILSHAAEHFQDGESVLVHCNGGICRSTAVAVALHVQCGFTPQEALERVRRVRPAMIPNTLVIKHADEILKQNGALIAAVAVEDDDKTGKFFDGEKWISFN